MLTQQHLQLVKYDRLITQRNKSLEEVGGICEDILQHSDEDFRCLYLNPKGRRWFGLEKEKRNLGNSVRMDAFYHPDTLNFELPNIKRYYKSDRGDRVYANYQQLYNPKKGVYTICLVLTKKVKIGYLSFLYPLDDELGISAKIKRVISEELFKRSHQKNFDSLTHRELEVLRLLADGVNNPCIAEKLFISRRTVEEHRKNINRKLEIRNLKDILEYAYAFDLI